MKRFVKKLELTPEQREASIRRANGLLALANGNPEKRLREKNLAACIRLGGKKPSDPDFEIENAKEPSPS